MLSAAVRELIRNTTEPTFFSLLLGEFQILTQKIKSAIDMNSRAVHSTLRFVQGISRINSVWLHPKPPHSFSLSLSVLTGSSELLSTRASVSCHHLTSLAHLNFCIRVAHRLGSPDLIKTVEVAPTLQYTSPSEAIKHKHILPLDHV